MRASFGYLLLKTPTHEKDVNRAKKKQYSNETAATLAQELLEDADKNSVIAIVSAPSVFVALKNELARSGTEKAEQPKVWLLEFDKRFKVFGEFVFYDFNEPCKLPREYFYLFDGIGEETRLSEENDGLG